MSKATLTPGFDAAAFLAAVQAAGKPAPKPVTLPGLGACFRRQLTVADVDAASALREKLKASGKDINQGTNIAIGLAQVLCGPDGTPVFDVLNDEHLSLLAALPWSSVSAFMNQDDLDGDDPAKNA